MASEIPMTHLQHEIGRHLGNVTGINIFIYFFFFFLLNNFLEIYSCRVKQIFKSRLYEVCENLCVEPIDIIKYIRIQSRARWIH